MIVVPSVNITSYLYKETERLFNTTAVQLKIPVAYDMERNTPWKTRIERFTEDLWVRAVWDSTAYMVKIFLQKYSQQVDWVSTQLIINWKSPDDCKQYNTIYEMTYDCDGIDYGYWLATEPTDTRYLFSGRPLTVDDYIHVVKHKLELTVSPPLTASLQPLLGWH